MRARAASLAVGAALAFAVATTSRAGAEDYFQGNPDEIVFRIDKQRTPTERIVVLSLLGGAVLFAGIGALFSLDYQDNADKVAATGTHTGKIYTPDIEDTRRDALRSRNLAIGSYAVGGGLLVAAAVYFVITDPGSQAVRYGPNGEIVPIEPATTIAPVEGGAVVGRRWRF